jgi:acyl-CoA synthetase (AMP-forming)/AMP-acid ligase II
MPHDNTSLWDRIVTAGDLDQRSLWGASWHIVLRQLVTGTSLDCAREELEGCSILIATADQLPAALALIELDGSARRLVLCPPGIADEYISRIIEAAGIGVVVSDGAVTRDMVPKGVRLVRASGFLLPAARIKPGSFQTDWVLMTSGTTGLPKLVLHTLSSLTGPIGPKSVGSLIGTVWATFYDIRRYGGVQIFLRALVGMGSMVLSSPGESMAEFLQRCRCRGVTHISGTPSHWRSVLMSGPRASLAANYIRLSGEVADQAILDDLCAFYPGAQVSHAFASTEAGVAFEVNDAIAGFPARLLGRGGKIEIKVEEGTLRIRSPRTAKCYIGSDGPLRDHNGFVDTGDLVELVDDRYHFRGRDGGVINVGGMKVYPEEVEAIINRHPAVQVSLVKASKNPFTGAVVVADVVLRPSSPVGVSPEATSAAEQDILGVCRRLLPSYKVPAVISIVSSIAVGASGKLIRPNA